jgi:hypothetical protein
MLVNFEDCADSRKETKRSLIFVGHSLGGLVIKQVRFNLSLLLLLALLMNHRHS